jgi:transcriptional regulator with XRE-family HTH domain
VAKRATAQLDLGPLLRGLRAKADLSQRELAAMAGVHQTSVARIESGASVDPSFRTVERLLQAVGCGFAADGTVLPAASALHERLRDGAGRHFPAHLDVREVADLRDWGGAWWAHWYNLPPHAWPVTVPAATFDLRRDRRDGRRMRQEARDGAVIRRVTEDLPESAWQWVAELPGRVVIGELRAVCATSAPDAPAPPEAEVVLVGVLVAPARRGAGIGRRLVEALFAEAERAGMRRVRAITEWPGALFLRRCGFREENRAFTFVRAIG